MELFLVCLESINGIEVEVPQQFSQPRKQKKDQNWKIFEVNGNTLNIIELFIFPLLQYISRTVFSFL